LNLRYIHRSIKKHHGLLPKAAKVIGTFNVQKNLFRMLYKGNWGLYQART